MWAVSKSVKTGVSDKPGKRPATSSTAVAEYVQGLARVFGSSCEEELSNPTLPWLSMYGELVPIGLSVAQF
jgi:hypothetical protein